MIILKRGNFIKSIKCKLRRAHRYQTNPTYPTMQYTFMGEVVKFEHLICQTCKREIVIESRGK